ncbi:MAG TPA: argininosuccinate lyase [Pyrinomonadaceae bacterium]|nr:argininosuccinate lyase [Pyrinomonadaceae bacterium]
MPEKKAKLWGGRFTEEPDEVFREFNDSLRFDCRLFVADVSASIAHANGLGRAEVISDDERLQIIDGLTELLEEEATRDGFWRGANAEDVHSFIEQKLIEKIGDAGRKLHTGRSRNDQVATAFRLWVRYEIESTILRIRDVQIALVSFAERHADAVIPGYTHLQRAQPVLFAHWCLAYVEMLKRDRERLLDTHKRVNILPLGSGALAGTGFPIDREAVAAELGFTGISKNSLDAVSDRDFAVEFTAACSLLMVHLSRLAEDLILYCSTEFGFVTLSDAVSSGSSLMPQKKNPDALELLRGKAGRVFGHNLGLLTMLKGLPLAYNKDMQEDKEAVFDTADTVNICLRAATIVLDNATLNEAKARDAATKGYLNATELADHLVKRGVPFRTAHETVGRAVLYAIDQGKELNELSMNELKEFWPDIDERVAEALSLDLTLNAKSATGGTSRDRVAEALASVHEYLNG